MDNKELAEFLRDKMLPYYQKGYRKLKRIKYSDIHRELDCLNMDYGICLAASHVFDVEIYPCVGRILLDQGCPIVIDRYPGDQRLKKDILRCVNSRIVWMEKFIKENI